MSEGEAKGRMDGPASGSDPQEAGASATQPMDIQVYIGTRLREVYDDVANQPIPDRFLDLMRQLDAK